MKRHKDALGIQQGARNVRAIARSLVEASDEAAREGVGAEQDAAVRMIVHQLARVCKVDEIAYGYDPATLKDVYCTLIAECEARAGEGAAAAATEPREPVTIPPVTTCVPDGSDAVAVVLHAGAEAPAQGQGAVQAGYVGGVEPRRGFLSRFLFRGEG